MKDTLQLAFATMATGTPSLSAEMKEYYEMRLIDSVGRTSCTTSSGTVPDPEERR